MWTKHYPARGYLYSLGLGVAIAAALKVEPVRDVVGYVGAIPFAGFGLLARFLFKASNSAIYLIFVVLPPIVLALLHIRRRRTGGLFRDSVFTLMLGAWVAYSVRELQFLCELASDWDAIEHGACAGIPGVFGF